MPEYRIYLIGPDSHFIQSEPILCADDVAAIEIAKQLIIHGRDVEFRQGDRKITRLIASPGIGTTVAHGKRGGRPTYQRAAGEIDQRFRRAVDKAGSVAASFIDPCRP